MSLWRVPHSHLLLVFSSFLSSNLQYHILSPSPFLFSNPFPILSSPLPSSPILSHLPNLTSPLPIPLFPSSPSPSFPFPILFLSSFPYPLLSSPLSILTPSSPHPTFSSSHLLLTPSSPLSSRHPSSPHPLPILSSLLLILSSLLLAPSSPLLFSPLQSSPFLSCILSSSLLFFPGTSCSLALNLPLIASWRFFL